MTISIGDVLRSDGTEFDFSYRAPLVGEEFADLDTVGEADVELKLSAVDGCVRVRGKLKVTVRLVCDVCLEPYEQVMVLPFDEEFLPEPDKLDPDEIYTYANYHLSPDKMLRDLILLNWPMRCRCSEECAAPING